MPAPIHPFPATALCLGLLLSACAETAKAETPKPAAEAETRRTPVTVLELSRREIQGKIETTAYLEAEHQVVVLARVAGRVAKVLVDEGSQVQAGALLARIEDREVRSATKQVEIQLADRRLRHELAQLESEAADQRELSAKTDLEKAKLDLARLEDLDPELVSPKDMDDARFSLRQAQNAARVSGFNARKAKLDVKVAKAAADESAARLVEVKVQLAEHEIRAPIAGVLSRRLIKGGETITTATELFEIVDTGELISYLERPQRELRLVAEAKEVLFRTDAYPKEVFRARVDMISPVIDRATGSFRIRVRVQDREPAVLRPGLYMRAEILTEARRQALMVPKTAILAEGDDSVVFVVRKAADGKQLAHRVKLRIGLQDELDVESLSEGGKGLQVGDLLVVNGQEDLSDGTEVELISR